MKNSSTAAQAPAWRQQLHYRLKEGALIALGALCLILWMALLTYNQNDPGWSHTSSAQQVQNAAGRAGAWCGSSLLPTLPPGPGWISTIRCHPSRGATAW